MKTAYIQVSDLPIQVERRHQPELRGRPLVVLKGPSGGRQEVGAASDEARALGVVPGQTLRQAEHLCPEVVALSGNGEAHQAAFAALLAALSGCSPIVEADRAGWGVELDAGGLELLFGPDQALASALVRRAARAGLRARVGLGPNRLVARLAAGLAAPGASIVVAPSETHAFLEPLPIDRLPLSEESRERLELLGVHTFGRLLRLPRTALARQVGPDALDLVRAADAEGEWLVPHRPPEWLAAEAEVDGALETRQQLQWLLAPLAASLADQLQERYLGASAVRLRLGHPERLAHLPGPTASAAVILETALSLAADVHPAQEDARPPDSLQLAVGHLGPLGGRQARLFERQGARRAQAAQAVEELAERFRGRLRAPAFGRSAVGR